MKHFFFARTQNKIDILLKCKLNNGSTHKIHTHTNTYSNVCINTLSVKVARHKKARHLEKATLFDL